MIDLTQYLSSITLKTAEKRLFWAFLKPIWVLKGIKIIFFTIISLYNDFWGQTKPLTTPNRDRLDTPHIIPYVHCRRGRFEPSYDISTSIRFNPVPKNKEGRCRGWWDGARVREAEFLLLTS